MTEPRNCPDCGVEPGQPHKDGCDIPSCTICGSQLLQCEHFPEGNTIWNGLDFAHVEMVIAEVLELYVRGPPWFQTTREKAEQHDMNTGKLRYIEALQKMRGSPL